MKKITAIIPVLFVLSCSTTKNVENLPKDVSLKPPREAQADADLQALKDLRQEIDSTAGSVSCTNADDWRISPIGSKPCGGPAAYLAYPKKLETEILPKIQDYTQKQSDYNRKKGLMSDCAIVPAPAGVKCENGKPVLIKATSAEVY